MCDICRWASVVAAIEADLEVRVVGHTALLLDALATVIQANEHVTPEQRDAAETVIEQRQGATS